MGFEKKPEKLEKFEVVYEDDECTQVWKYNLKKFDRGPIEVETRWKKNFNPWNKKKKTLGDLAKEFRQKNLKIISFFFQVILLYLTIPYLY